MTTEDKVDIMWAGVEAQTKRIEELEKRVELLNCKITDVSSFILKAFEKENDNGEI